MSHVLQQEEDWEGAAKALIRIPLESSSRSVHLWLWNTRLMTYRIVADEEKLSVYMKIVRLLLEVCRIYPWEYRCLFAQCEEWGQAQTYFSRASLLIHTTTDKVTLLQYRLSQVSSLYFVLPVLADTLSLQARLFDFSARFNEAAQRYHELSFDPSIDEGDRLQMLYVHSPLLPHSTLLIARADDLQSSSSNNLHPRPLRPSTITNPSIPQP